MRKYTDNAWFSALFLPLCGLLVLGTLLWLNPIPADDTATRYAPMAQVCRCHSFPKSVFGLQRG